MSELLYSLPTWDLHNLGTLFKPDFNLDAYGFMNGSTEQTFRSPEMDYSDVSTGYLEDALIEFGERSKRRRLLFEDPSNSSNDNYWQNDWGLHEIESNSCLNSQFVTPHVSKDERKSEINSSEEPISTVYESPDTSVSSDKIYVREKSPTEPSSSNYGNKNKRLIMRLVYPFGLVKPGGREDDVTLNDINEKILMAPSRPVRHPVGDFASRPCVYGHGPGLSGKAVVALTRIQTQGNGTITIIRTKG
ncbi:Protein XRI1 [Cardamine amara subsp. amara]|uniref:Protein XRI1 n=1 Tax=Cardamine amara subsp. amara TaxID=228776 RepID=A0ABD1BV70_CARAN